MDDVARLAPGDRADLFKATAARRRLTAAIIEKDFWICCQVKTLAAEHTFWEKATILHAWCHAPTDKAFRDRQSRHYYDLVRLDEHDLGKAAIKDVELLLKVA
jgi:hypothetical protein